MIIFLDTAAWIKYFFAEASTTAVQDFLLQQSQNPESIFTASVITYAEIHATFARAWKRSTYYQ
jgi:hypothetical protein